MTERIPTVGDIMLALESVGYTDAEASEGVARIKRRWIGIGREMAREALLSDETVERAARTITPELYYHYDEWDDANEEDRARALKMSRTALTAALDASE